MTAPSSIAQSAAEFVSNDPLSALARTFEFVGMNRRYNSDVTWQAIAEAVLRPLPVSLTPEEIGEGRTDAEYPIPVSALVRFVAPTTPVRVEGIAVAWTRRAVLLRFQLKDGTHREAWLSASTVDRL